MLSLRVITIRERGTRFNYFREISRVREMYVKKKKNWAKIGQVCKTYYARWKLLFAWVKVSLFFSTMNCKRKRVKLFSKRWVEISRMKFNGEARLIGKFEE